VRYADDRAMRGETTALMDIPGYGRASYREARRLPDYFTAAAKSYSRNRQPRRAPSLRSTVREAERTAPQRLPGASGSPLHALRLLASKALGHERSEIHRMIDRQSIVA
jgi:hypothetical protein